MYIPRDKQVNIFRVKSHYIPLDWYLKRIGVVTDLFDYSSLDDFKKGIEDHTDMFKD